MHVYPDFEQDMFSFLGASYLRAVGGTNQYRLSARGLAVDTGLPRDEELPGFRLFWLERPSTSSESVTIYALLDSRSITGACTFKVKAGDLTVMEIEAVLYPRTSIEGIGIAPLTSLFQCRLHSPPVTAGPSAPEHQPPSVSRSFRSRPCGTWPSQP